MKIKLVVIGTIYTDFNNRSDVPIQARHANEHLGRVELLEEYERGLKALDGFSHAHLIYFFHHQKRYNLTVKPVVTETSKGIFATRAPARPNPLGTSIVELVSVKKNIIMFRGVDIMNNTPLLDIKPYVHEFDTRTRANCGWYDSVANSQIARGASDPY
ncbi:MAG: tRNA (N6-threonylcarbamoyladenosine(37)-N6)-methyltransferase TrmO [Elusimicrobiota bacterium]